MTLGGFSGTRTLSDSRPEQVAADRAAYRSRVGLLRGGTTVDASQPAPFTQQNPFSQHA